MNLVAKEYVACQGTAPGCSCSASSPVPPARWARRSGSTRTTRRGRPMPWSRALEMPEEERRDRQAALLRRVRKRRPWPGRGGRSRTSVGGRRPRCPHHGAAVGAAELHELRRRFAAAATRACYLDYDGTLVPIAPRPADAIPGTGGRRDGRDPRPRPARRSRWCPGRPRADLERWFGHLDGAWLAAEHGALVGRRGARVAAAPPGRGLRVDAAGPADPRAVRRSRARQHDRGQGATRSPGITGSSKRNSGEWLAASSATALDEPARRAPELTRCSAAARWSRCASPGRTRARSRPTSARRARRRTWSWRSAMTGRTRTSSSGYPRRPHDPRRCGPTRARHRVAGPGRGGGAARRARPALGSVWSGFGPVPGPVFKTGGAAPGVARWVRLPCAPASCEVDPVSRRIAPETGSSAELHRPVPTMPDWAAYYRHTLGREPRPLFARGMAALAGVRCHLGPGGRDRVWRRDRDPRAARRPAGVSWPSTSRPRRPTSCGLGSRRRTPAASRSSPAAPRPWLCRRSTCCTPDTRCRSCRPRHSANSGLGSGATSVLAGISSSTSSGCATAGRATRG